MADTKIPTRGDTVFVKDGESWLGGIVNSVGIDGTIIVGVRGHSKGASLVGVKPLDYLKDWCYPGDIDKQSLQSERL